jgi:serine/threonine-protein kinase
VLIETLEGVLGTASGQRSAAPRAATNRFVRETSDGEGAGTRATISPAIGVLPFTDVSADLNSDFIGDGLAEEILGALANLKGLRVAARTSCFAFKGKNVDIREIGRQLGVGYLLEGSVRRGSGRLRVAAQLIDAESGHHLWSERYDRGVSDLFAMQDDITTAIRDALSERLLGIGRAAPSSPSAIDPKTYELFLRGRYLMRLRAQGMRAGMEAMQEVTAQAPNYAPGFVELGFSHAVQVWYGQTSPRDGWPAARAAAERAISLDPLLGNAHILLGIVSLWFDWDWAAARSHLEQGLALGSGDGEAYGNLCYLSLITGTDAEAIAYAERRFELDPLNPSAALNLVVTSYLCRRYPQCIAAADKIIQIAPDFGEAHRWKGLALRATGDLAAALKFTQMAVLLMDRHPWALLDLFELLMALGRFADAGVIKQELQAMRNASRPLPDLLFAILDGIGEKGELYPDKFFAGMEASLAARDFWLVMQHRDPRTDAMREDARFKDVLRRIGHQETSPA